MLRVPLTKEELREVVLETLRRNGLRDGYVRLVVSRGPGDLGLDPRKSTVVVIAEGIQLYPQTSSSSAAVSCGLRRCTWGSSPPGGGAMLPGVHRLRRRPRAA